ncbi:M15 family metallopeptidase [Arthrobacter sp. NPDC090010]|uniref:M15 family metallopeptidase n=1 Tax=Arthrobacter sp. NPDC090010 TaxID=3363942 RepID=UPI00381246EE
MSRSRRRLLGALCLGAVLVTACTVPAVLPVIGSAPAASAGGSVNDDGAIPLGSPVSLDSGVPAVSWLRPGLLKALRDAQQEAAPAGVSITISSGWRSERLQEQLLDDATRKYGSRAEAARWVATPSTSPHVTGDAVDVGNEDAMSWLAQHGARFGLCQIYANERWHFELRPAARQEGCPVMYPDPSVDPRMAA